MTYVLTFSRKHHYWGMQSGVIIEGTLSDCEQHKAILDSLFPHWYFNIIHLEKQK
jgi:hypothetical protein